MSRPLTYKKRYEAALREIRYLRGIIYSVPRQIECTCRRPSPEYEHEAACKRASVRRMLREAVDGRPLA